MPILADVFMLLSCPVCHDIQCFKLCDINEKRKVGKTFICNSVTLFDYIQNSHTSIYRRKTKNDQNFTMWMLELFMDVDKLVDIRN